MQKFIFNQELPISIDECWQFFSKPKNLATITPPYLGFSSDHDEQEMYAGQIITHTIRPICAIPIVWVTEITHVHQPYYFVDEQRFGPYKFWHHQHRFIPTEKGVRMIDTLHYSLPFGIIGKIVDKIKVSKDIKNIFNYRYEKLNTLFAHR